MSGEPLHHTVEFDPFIKVKVKLHQAINFETLCGANSVVQSSKSERTKPLNSNGGWG